jgi:hypothetical protein
MKGVHAMANVRKTSGFDLIGLVITCESHNPSIDLDL